ncbi:MAG: type II 3-dehydroquinate dehydratase [Candidatus Sericytochromatia bacterium]|nr:type II 3-dehydroquinate dehydratase [Candidatus Sericytochromatia bacterium]
MGEPSWTIWVLHGPNLNLLGRREPEIYGAGTLEALDAEVVTRGAAMGAAVMCRQTNHEGVLLDWIHGALDQGVDALILNPAALTHTSVALRDALAAYAGVKVEVHLSNVWQREPFRHGSFVSPVVDGVVAGFGAGSYVLGLQAAVRLLRARAGAWQG